jgi:putative flippase GtrA
MTPTTTTVARYLVVGGANTAVTYAVYLALLPFLAYGTAYTVAFLTGIVIAYALQSRYVFRTRATWQTTLVFPLIYLVPYAAGRIALRLLVESGVASREVALAGVLLVTVPIGFVASRALFRGRRDGGGLEAP